MEDQHVRRRRLLHDHMMIIWPARTGILHLFRFLIWPKIEIARPTFLQGSGFHQFLRGKDHRWVIFVSVLMRNMLHHFALPIKYFGYLVDFILNLIYLNGNPIALIFNFLQGKVVMPKRDTKKFISSIGHLDGRIDLLSMDHLAAQGCNFTAAAHHGNKALLDLCIMASKLAYENACFVKDVVVNHWKMHFVGFYNCWNDFQKRNSTQVLILCDRPKDANLILVSFRGTEPFDADDWSTDFDYSWYEVPDVGKLHMGFVEAMGLGNRAETSSFKHHLLGNLSKLVSSQGSETELYMDNMGAYYVVKNKLNQLLAENTNANIVITGHSLGGALAILFPTVLFIQKEDEMIRRMVGVYTFGQPRIGDTALGNFMEGCLKKPGCPKYVRVVYCNDIVPRIPCDDKAFLFKHFGRCLYYNSLYTKQVELKKVGILQDLSSASLELGGLISHNLLVFGTREVDEDEPNRNYFGFKYTVPAHLNAVWELIRAFMIGYSKGPQYKEGWFSIWLRVVGLAFPGLSAHSTRDYVNSIRLG